MGDLLWEAHAIEARFRVSNQDDLDRVETDISFGRNGDVAGHGGRGCVNLGAGVIPEVDSDVRLWVRH